MTIKLINENKERISYQELEKQVQDLFKDTNPNNFKIVFDCTFNSEIQLNKILNDNINWEWKSNIGNILDKHKPNEVLYTEFKLICGITVRLEINQQVKHNETLYLKQFQIL